MHNIEVEVTVSGKWRAHNEQILSPYESYRLYTTALKSLSSWPEGFYEFLTNYRDKRVSDTGAYVNQAVHQKGELITGSLYDNLDGLYSRCLMQYWKYPEFSFIKEAFLNHIADNYWLNRKGELGNFCRNNPEFAERCQWVDISNAALFLNMSPNEVELLFRSEQVICKNSGGHILKLVKKDQVFSLNNSDKKLMPLGRVVRLLGLKESIIKNLVRTGLISSQNSSARNGFPVEEFTATSVIAFLEKMLHHIKEKPVQTIGEESDWIDLIKAGYILYKAKLDIGVLFLQILRGNLWMYRPKDQSPRLGDMLFKYSEIQTLIETIQRDNVMLETIEVASLQETCERVLED